MGVKKRERLTSKELVTSIENRGNLVVQKAKKLLSGLPKRKVSLKTADEYRRTYERLRTLKMAPEQGTESKNTYFKRRAAVTFVTQEMLVDLLQRQAEEIKVGDLEAWKRSVRQIQTGLGILDRYPPQKYERQGIIEGKKCPVEHPKKKKSKRLALRGLDKDWREKMFSKAYGMKDQKYLPALAVLDLTGARPAEIRKGITVRVETEKSVVCCRIDGAKRGVDNKKGQKWRQICWKYDLSNGIPETPSPEMYLAAIAHQEGGEMVVSVENPSCFGDWVRNLGKKIWPRKRNKISPYVYRHQIAADLKKNGDGYDKIATLLGHSVEHTQKHYGVASQGSGRRSPDQISCSSRPARKKGNPFSQGMR